MKKKRLTFKCYNCKETYSLLIDIEGSPKLSLECPFCSKESTVDLAPFMEQITTIYRSYDPRPGVSGSQLNAPYVIPTEAQAKS